MPRQAKTRHNICVSDTECVEVCDGDRLVGYAIWFSGGWNTYYSDDGNGLWKGKQNIQDRDEAINELEFTSANPIT